MIEKIKSAGVETTAGGHSWLKKVISSLTLPGVLTGALIAAPILTSGCAFSVRPDGTVDITPYPVEAALYPDGVYFYRNHRFWYSTPYSPDMVLYSNYIYGPSFGSVYYVPNLFVRYDDFHRPVIVHQDVVINNTLVNQTFTLQRDPHTNNWQQFHHPKSGAVPVTPGTAPKGTFGGGKVIPARPHDAAIPKGRPLAVGGRPEGGDIAGRTPSATPHTVTPPAAPQNIPANRPAFNRPGPGTPQQPAFQQRIKKPQPATNRRQKPDQSTQPR